jgi:membrane-associated HD superfamily phosphohydrolase
VKLARKYKLPESTDIVYHNSSWNNSGNYFYKMYQNENPESEIDIKDFTYPGPLPHSKETSVVMIIDGIEAASRSLKEKTHESLKELIENMVEQKIKSGQLQNAELTFRDISILKATLLDELINVYHARIAYPK